MILVNRKPTATLTPLSKNDARNFISTYKTHNHLTKEEAIKVEKDLSLTLDDCMGEVRFLSKMRGIYVDLAKMEYYTFKT
jgi:hypothetical protein